MDAAPSELALWRQQPVDVAVEARQIVEVFPTIAVNDGSALIEFRIPAQPDTVLDLFNTTFRCGYQILDASGAKITPGANVCLTNLPLHATIESVEITIGGKSLTSGTSANYPYKAYIDTVVNGATNEHEAHAAGFSLDTPGGMNTVGVPKGDQRINSASQHRLLWSALGEIVRFEGTLFPDVCLQSKYIPLVDEVCIRMHQASDAFRLMATDEITKYQLKLVQPLLRARTVQLTPQGIRELSLNKSNYKIPIKNNVINTYNIPNGGFSHHIDSPFGGRLPNRLIAGFVAADAYQGRYASNPFNFEPLDIQEMSFTLNERSLPGPPIETDYDRNDYITAFRALTNGVYPTRVPLDDPYSTTPSNQYYKGYCFTVFTLNGESNGGELRSPARFGLTRYTVKFRVALPKPVTLILYATFDDELEIPL